MALIALYRNMKSLVALSFCLLAVVGVHGQEDFTQVNDIDVFRKLAGDISENTKTIQCAFVQEKHLSFMEKPVVSKGKFYFGDESQIRWEYTDPFSYVILMHDDVLTILDEGDRSDMTMSDHPAFRKVQRLLSTVMRGDLFAAEKEFNMSFYENDHQYRIDLVPKDKEMQDFIAQMDLYFDKSDMMMSKFEMHEAGGDITKTKFSDRLINSKLPEGIFEIRDKISSISTFLYFP